MSASKRALIILLATLAVFLTSVFLFGGNAQAQGVIDSEITSPLRENEPVLEKHTQLVEEKTTQLKETTQEIQDIESKKQALAQEIDTIKAELDDIQQKLADKKAKVEAERKRVEQLRNMFVRVSSYAVNSSGNTYAAGYCTWYAKSRRPDIPNNLGNANTWYARAASQGWNVGLTPKKGAVATTTAGGLGHVAYVEGVSLDGQYVTVSEMNYVGRYIVSSRTVHYSEFRYIYELP